MGLGQSHLQQPCRVGRHSEFNSDRRSQPGRYGAARWAQLLRQVYEPTPSHIRRLVGYDATRLLPGEHEGGNHHVSCWQRGVCLYPARLSDKSAQVVCAGWTGSEPLQPYLRIGGLAQGQKPVCLGLHRRHHRGVEDSTHHARGLRRGRDFHARCDQPVRHQCTERPALQRAMAHRGWRERGHLQRPAG